MLLLKALARVVEVLLMAAIALVGLGIGLYCLDGLVSIGSARPDRLLNLPTLRHDVGHWLAQLAAPGPIAVLALLGGIAAVLVGLLLAVGLLGSRRERLLVIEEDTGEGGLYARRRPIGQMAREETARAPGVTDVKRPKVRLTRSGRAGRLKVLAARGPDPDAETVDTAVHERLDPLGEALHLRVDSRVRLVEPEAAPQAPQGAVR